MARLGVTLITDQNVKTKEEYLSIFAPVIKELETIREVSPTSTIQLADKTIPPAQLLSEIKNFTPLGWSFVNNWINAQKITKGTIVKEAVN